MIFSLRLFLVTFLVLLQCIAPLVHAHTSEKVLSQGLHIPGLERYASDTRLSSDDVLCKATAFCSNIDGQVVGVNTGLSREFALPAPRLYKIIADLDHYYLATHSAVFQAVIIPLTTTLATQAIVLLNQLASYSHSPRAPPTQVLL